MPAYGEERYADAREAVRGALEHMPDHAGLNYNYACFATLAGDTSDDTFAHLRRSVELRPQFREHLRDAAALAAADDAGRHQGERESEKHQNAHRDPHPACGRDHLGRE